ncbi:MAG: hypothetical protein ABFD54_10350 [Armatimonadota bacterium]|nr:hypothetical protein [bacterium]
MSNHTRAKVSFRASTYIWLGDERFDELLSMMSRFRDTVDEVACFTSFTHPPLPLEEIQRRAEVLKDRIPRLRQIVPSVGINHLATLGHLNENLANSLNEPWQRLMGIDGDTIAGCYCPSDESMQDYVRKTYVTLAEAEPDFIWVDDDVRMEGHGIPGLTCFCERCLDKFNHETGKHWTRESLKDAINGGSVQERVSMRKQWLAHNRSVISDLLALIRDAVDSVDRSIPLGLMTGEIFYSGFGFDDWAKSMAGKDDVKVMWRPGGGFYGDDNLPGFVTKAHSIGRQVSVLGPKVVDIQSEIENFPYQMLKKSTTTLGLECATYIGTGCTGAALNLMGIASDPIAEYAPNFERVKQFRPFMDAEVQAFGRSKCEGVWAAFTTDSTASLNADADWFQTGFGAELDYVQELSEIGIPIAYARDGASVTLIKGDSCLAFPKDQLEEILSGSVLMDGPALRRLNEMGMSALTGFDIAGVRNVDSIEVFTNDELNGKFAGWHRDTRPSFWAESAYILKPLDTACRTLSEVIDFTNTSFGPIMGIYENRNGGRIAVAGYSPWRSMQTLAKTSQVKSLVRWLSKDTLPAWVASYHKTALWCRSDAQGKRSMLLLNACLDSAQDIELRVLNSTDSLRLLHVNGKSEVLEKKTTSGPYSVFELPQLAPWEIVLLTSC